MSFLAYDHPAANHPPRVVGTDPADAWLSAATAAVATSTDLWATYVPPDNAGASGPPKGKVWIEIEVTGFDAYLRFSRTATTGTTAANGSLIRIAHTSDNRFYIDPTKDLFLDHISPGGVGVVKWRVCSALGDRVRA